MSAESSISSNQPVRREGPVARAIERQTSKIPSDVFLWGAGAAMIASGVIQLLGIRRMRAMGRVPWFVIGRRIETLVPALLVLGVYNKMVKMHGS